MKKADGSFDPETYVMSAGFRSFDYFLKFFVVPISFAAFVVFGVLFWFFAEFSIFIPITVLVFGIVAPLIYPLLVRGRIQKDMMENLHYFITYANALSLLDLDLSNFFHRLGQKSVYGELAKVCDKIYYLSNHWTLGFANTCHRVANYIPLKLVADFFDRFGLALDYGQSMKVFLKEEQKAVVEDFVSEYEKGLEKIKVAKEVFVSLSFLTGYVLVVALLVPMLAGISADLVMKAVLAFSATIDLFLLVFILGFVSSDSIYVKTKILTSQRIKLYIRVGICSLFSFILLISLFLFADFTFLVTVTLGLLPMAYVGYYAKRMDDSVMRIDRTYPEFLRTFGQTLAIKKMDFGATLEAVKVHDFGALNGILRNIRRRFRIGSDKFKCWDYFAAESGSSLISRFNSIFIETTTQGGDPVKISEVINQNFLKMITLKKLRSQLASGFRGSFYGAVASFSVVAYFSIQISSSLGSIFASPYEGVDDQTAALLSSSLSGIIPESFSIDIQLINFFLGLIIILHAIVSGIILKHIDGGSKIAGFLDVVLVLIVGSFISVVITAIFTKYPII